MTSHCYKKSNKKYCVNIERLIHEDIFDIMMNLKRSWRNGYHKKKKKKWTQWLEFKPRTKLLIFPTLKDQ